MLTCGIVGLPMSGKSTLFSLLTESDADVSKPMSTKPESNTGMARVPDARLSHLSEIYCPRKTTYAQVMVSDVPGLITGTSGGQSGSNRFLSDIRGVDALLVVVRVFRDDSVAHVEGSLDPVRDLSTIESELILSDLQMIENRLLKLSSSRKLTPEQKAEIPVLEKIREGFMDELWLADQPLTAEERGLLQGYGLLTTKPVVLVVNLDEDQLASHSYDRRDELMAYVKRRGCGVVELSAKIENEISSLEEADREALMSEYGIDEPGISKVARCIYSALGLISFFTVGKDEVRAWTIARGTSAKRAARVIHSDIERGFIRAEVVSYDDFVKAGSMQAARSSGTLRLEGKDYEVQDGDIIEFRFNV